MKDIIKSMLTIAVFASAFFLGFYLGQEKVISMIPKFQDEQEETD
ncbi:MAG: hypothetical protein ABIJ35_07000 [Acidobacteriota bacterium]